ncbi:hypothetical protein [Streptomyces sp. NPDC088725]
MATEDTDDPLRPEHDVRAGRATATGQDRADVGMEIHHIIRHDEELNT